jgi:hypothetical protein
MEGEIMIHTIDPIDLPARSYVIYPVTDELHAIDVYEQVANGKDVYLCKSGIDEMWRLHVPMFIFGLAGVLYVNPTQDVIEIPIVAEVQS